MNIKVNTMERGQFWATANLNLLKSYNRLEGTTFEFDAKIIHQLNSGC